MVNPISGTGNKSHLLYEVAARTQEKRIPFEIIPTNAANDYAALREKIVSESITDVVIIGGGFGDYATPEQSIPATVPDGTWETSATSSGRASRSFASAIRRMG